MRGQADADSAHRFAQVRGVAQVAEVEFVRGGRAERLGESQVEQLRAASVERVEARDVRAALRDRVGIVLRPVVEKVVSGEQAEARVGVEAVGALVVAQGLVEGRGGERAVGIIGRGNVLQQIGPGRDPGGCRNRGVRKDASRCGIIAGASAARGMLLRGAAEVIRLAGLNGVSQFARKSRGDVRPAHDAGYFQIACRHCRRNPVD